MPVMKTAQRQMPGYKRFPNGRVKYNNVIAAICAAGRAEITVKSGFVGFTCGLP
jgi:hypothetical protein